MKAVAITSALLATGAIAAPNTAARWARHAARRQAGGISTVDPISLSPSWSGAVMTQSARGISAVTGTIKIPVPGTEIKSASSAAWVGIDGDTCNFALLQTGVDFVVDSDGAVTYTPWYEWWPSVAVIFDNFTVSAGDELNMTVVTDSTLRSGTATLENLSTGAHVNHTFDAFSTESLCGQDADWIVEDYMEGLAEVTLNDFSTVTFTNASAIRNGEIVGISNYTIMDINQNSVNLTDCAVPDSHTVTCTYVPTPGQLGESA
ncbi:peptidase A4 family-domain-containing protein [Xylaria sp. CBS 124048]|nr:peptidase A4 family-domain-containing protein [Xylaria sp. CBS 124048]